VGQAGVFSAAAAGACHRRERWFLLAALAGSPAERQDPREPPGGEEPGRWGQSGNGHRPPGGVDALPGGDAFVACMPDGSIRDYGPALARHAARLGRPFPRPLVGRYLSGDFSAWMMMLPEDWLAGLSNSAKKRLAGNAVCPPQAEQALRGLLARLEALPGSDGRTGAFAAFLDH
jgi:site-specific DNA-cytosine methylase